MKILNPHSFAIGLMFATGAIAAYAGDSPPQKAISIYGNIADNPSENKDTIHVGATINTGSPKSIGKAESLHCYQHGIRIINEELAPGGFTQVSGLGLTTTGDADEHIAVVALGDSLCIIHSKIKPAQQSQQFGLPANSETKRKH